jgi:hypothetical protein
MYFLPSDELKTLVIMFIGKRARPTQGSPGLRYEWNLSAGRLPSRKLN